MKRSADSLIDYKNDGNSLCITFILYIVNNSVTRMMVTVCV